jgi:uncharacterized Fe-S cluster-containing radical SAM superfamily protein
MAGTSLAELAMSTMIDTDKFSSALRERGVDLAAQLVAITRFDGSLQEQDLTEPTNCDGYGRIRHFRRRGVERWPENPLPIDPAARALGMSRPPSELRAQVFQNAVCNWRCWYCYVDFALLSGSRDRSELLSAEELFGLYLDSPNCPSVIDLTGGQPDLVPEWIVWMLEERRRRGLDSKVFVWSDDNLSNAYFWEKLTPAQRRTVFEAPAYGKVCCFKGFDEASFAFNTGATPELFDRQFQLMGRLMSETPLDLYAYATFTDPDGRNLEVAMRAFVDRLQEIDEALPLRTVPLLISAFEPTRGRMTEEHTRALAVQNDAVAAWRDELDARFALEDRIRRICDVELRAG